MPWSLKYSMSRWGRLSPIPGRASPNNGRIGEARKGAIFVVWHSIDAAPDADVVGGLEQNDARLALGIDPASAIVMAQHPLARVAARELIPPLSTLQSE